MRGDEHEWEERPNLEGAPPRRIADITSAGSLTQSRARIWRLPPGTRGRRHREPVQEEFFVVHVGTLTILLGDPPARHDLPPESVVSVAAGTALQLRNESDAEVVVFAYGAPPATDRAHYLDDVDLD
jgi:uncharacterized cupin superfamily protein